MKQRHHEIIISDHAWQRWQERSGIEIKRTKLINVLTGKLNGALAVGLVLDHTSAGWLEVTPWLWATVRLTNMGWLVATFTAWEEREAG
ncbi:MAG: hypothetical protein VR69_09575 [Peptococcaceae bacterium BRH_c4b]|nr:MAG: hypothetical protein VR69_09575 [Peptococcaceae bacterium BRH_c4b]